MKLKKTHYFLSVLIIFLLTFGVVAYIQLKPYIGIEPVTKDSLEELDLDKYNKLMIVAHPDDEFIWGGAHLLSDDYLVVCITNGTNKVRKNEFYSMMNETGDIGLILSYPDKIAGKRSDWTFCYDNIEEDLKTILAYKDWELVVTHNEDGEYGHRHHVMTHDIVTDAYDVLDLSYDFYYFGKYYRVEDVPNDLTYIDEQLYEKKRELVFTYDSQMDTMRKLYHMLNHENWDLRQ